MSATERRCRWQPARCLGQGLLVGLALLLTGASPDAAAQAPGAISPAPLAAPVPSPIRAMNRHVATLRANPFGVAPQTRAAEAEHRIELALRGGGALQVGVVRRDPGAMVQIDGASMFMLVPEDTTDSTPEAAHAEAQLAAAALEQVIAATRESRDLKALLRAGAIALAASAGMWVALVALRRLRRRLGARLAALAVVHSRRLRVDGVEVVRSEGLVRLLHLVLAGMFWLLTLLVMYAWTSVVLGLFPYTRPWADRLDGFLIDLLLRFALATAHAVPGLLAAALIFWAAWALSAWLRRFFGSIAAGQITVGWVDPDVARTTSRLCISGVWLFALAMAYPYLPGSDTEAFKGVSVLVGLMISLGASNLVGQFASGLILTYTRTFRTGEYVRIGAHEGTVMTQGTFTTRLRTGMGEEITISNNAILGEVTRNYSRAVKGPGYIVDTTVTIGYDTPWRQVVAMLEEAARRTAGVLADPKPQVFQVALSDFYPEYRLVCQAVPHEPRPRALVTSELHANVQDVFNENGVQIMSPHYRSDPPDPKVVPPAAWYPPPARRPGDEG
jgi:small-conductance mechanosensitive channel